MKSFSLKFNTYYRLRWIEYLILFLVLFLSFYYGMSTYAIENINEGLYAEIPREMLQIGNYIIPNLNFVPYIEKPPLFYWMIALSYKIFGVSEWSARVVPATSAALVCLSLVFFGNRIRRNREGWIAAIILATSIGFVAIARVLILDMVLTLFFTMSLVSFYIWHTKGSRSFLRLFYCFLGLAFLTKGLLSVILIPAIALIFILFSDKPFKKSLQFFDPVGILIFAAMVVPWHFLAIKREADFVWDYFVNEQVFRFLDKRIPHDYHTGSLFFYLPKIFLYLFPWSILSFLLFKPDRSSDKSLYRFLWLWLMIPLIFFSVSRAKGDYYMIISMPALALLLALKINEIFATKSNGLIYFFAFFGAFETLSFGLLYSATIQNKLSNYLPEVLKLDSFFITPLLYFFIGVGVATLTGIFICLNFRKKPTVHFSAIICLILFLVAFYVINKQKIEYRTSEVSLADYINQHDPSRPVYLYQDYEKISSILFYLKKRLPLIDSKSNDLHYGMQRPTADGWFFSLNNFMDARDKEVNYVIARKDRFVDFLHSVAPKEYCIVAQTGTSVLLSNKVEDCGS